MVKGSATNQGNATSKLRPLKPSKTRAAWGGLQTTRLSRAGQNPVVGTGCIATKVSGSPCPNLRVESHMPYCKSCLCNGDPSLRVVKHPKFGRCLIATRKLKKGYVCAWWGDRVGKNKLPAKSWEWALESRFGVIDAVPHKKSSFMQFCQCVGPSERPTIDDCPTYYEALLARKEKTCLLFSTMCEVPKNHQLTMMYNKDEKTTNEFFQERGLTRADVGCRQYPALKKRGRE